MLTEWHAFEIKGADFAPVFTDPMKLVLESRDLGRCPHPREEREPLHLALAQGERRPHPTPLGQHKGRSPRQLEFSAI